MSSASPEVRREVELGGKRGSRAEMNPCNSNLMTSAKQPTVVAYIHSVFFSKYNCHNLALYQKSVFDVNFSLYHTYYTALESSLCLFPPVKVVKP